MALIDEREGSVALGKLVYLVKGSNVTIHGEDPVGDDHSEAAILGFLKHLLEYLHVHMFIAKSSRLAKPDTINN